MSTHDPDSLRARMTHWRHELHARPETGFEEIATATYVASVLEALGLEVHRGIGGTGLVANLTCGDGRTVGLRADMDALNIQEASLQHSRASRTPGKMHACGHDGHMAMVLGAAHLLAERRDFSGTVRFIFQPAEEHGRGAKAMMQDGLLQRFPVDMIFGAHNMPGLPAGIFATRAGGIMACEDNFVIRIKGRGTHAARPHMGADPIVIAAQIILALQTIVSRNLDPSQSAVLSCTEVVTDGIRNVIPANVTIKGDTRSYSEDVRRLLEHRMRELARGICSAHGAECDVEYTREFAATINPPSCVDVALAAATAVVGAGRVEGNVAPMMISEDFGAFLEQVPGNFMFIGNGTEEREGGTPLHSSKYDFNDEILEVGARYFAEVARGALRPGR